MPNSFILNILNEYKYHPDFLDQPILDINQRGIMDDTVLHIAVRCNHIEHVRFFLENGADINMQGDMGFTPLHYACMRGNKEIISILLNYGANKNIMNEFKQTALDVVNLSNIENKKEIIKRLKQK